MTGMKKIWFLVLLLLLTASQQLLAQAVPYKVVFDLTSGESGTYDRVMRWVKSISAAHPDAQISIVYYGKALPMVEKATAKHADDITKLAQSGKVAFSVCEQAMKVHQVSRDMLLPGVGTVPDAIYEIIQKQAAGYGYIKVVD